MIYLASDSPRRKQLLKEAQVAFKVLKAPYHEAMHRDLSPSALVKKHALGKAMATAKLLDEGKVLAADTVVYFRGEIIGKPLGKAHALRVLNALQGQAHTVYTGVAFLEVKKGKVVKQKLFSEKTKVFLRPMSHDEIRRYFRLIDPLDKAGAYAIQAKGAGIVKKVEGSYTNAVGLPMERLHFL